MTFAEKLQQLRKEKNFSQEQLATQLTVSRQAVSKWETGESLPDAGKLVQISRLFDVSVDALLKDELELQKISAEAVWATQDNVAGNQKKEPHTALLILGTVFSALGALGFAVIWVLSTMIESFADSQTTNLSTGETWYTYGPGYSFGGFVERYRLEAILVLCGVCIVLGICFFVARFCKRRNKSFFDLLGM